jgi:predicted metal-dependent phosphoesterase TrpH
MSITRRRFLQVTAGVGAVAVLPGLRHAADAADAADKGGAPTRGQWLAGDFHVHTTYSHDVWSGPGDDNTDTQELYTLGWTPAEQISLAEGRGLDFVALTDHNRLDVLRDPGYRSSKLVLVPGYEHSLSGGHAGVFVPSRADLPDLIRNPDGSTGFPGSDGVQRFLAEVHGRGGVAVLNHPTSNGAKWRYDPSASLDFDAVEAWNGRWQQRAETVPFSYSDNYKAVPWFESNFLPHRHMGITGGSDNHWRSVTAAAGVGQPTTWVYAANRSAPSIIDAIRAGRTFVSAEPPLHGGPRVFLSTVDKRGREAIVGGRVPSLTPLTVRVTVEGGTGQRLRLISTGQVVSDQAVLGPVSAHEVSVVMPKDGWLRAELLVDGGFLVTAVTSPIFAARKPIGRPVAPTAGLPVSYASPPTTLPEVHCC